MYGWLGVAPPPPHPPPHTPPPPPPPPPRVHEDRGPRFFRFNALGAAVWMSRSPGLVTLRQRDSRCARGASHYGLAVIGIRAWESRAFAVHRGRRRRRVPACNQTGGVLGAHSRPVWVLVPPPSGAAWRAVISRDEVTMIASDCASLARCEAAQDSHQQPGSR